MERKQIAQKVQYKISPQPSDHVVVYAAKPLARRYSADNLSQLGGQLAYFFVLSLFPFLMLINQIVSNFKIDILAWSQQLQSFIPDNMLTILESYLGYLSQSPSTGVFTFSILSTIYLASKAVTSVLYALNRAFRSEKKITFVRQIFSFLFTALTLVVIYLSIIFASIGKNLFEQFITHFQLNENWVIIWQYIRWLIPIGGSVVALMLLYNIIPPKNFPRKYIFIGALFSVILWQMMALGLSFYTDNFGRYSIVYGSLGAMMIMLMFLYYSGIIIVLGGELAHILAMRAQKKYEYDVIEYQEKLLTKLHEAMDSSRALDQEK